MRVLQSWLTTRSGCSFAAYWAIWRFMPWMANDLGKRSTKPDPDVIQRRNIRPLRADRHMLFQPRWMTRNRRMQQRRTKRTARRQRRHAPRTARRQRRHAPRTARRQRRKNRSTYLSRAPGIGYFATKSSPAAQRVVAAPCNDEASGPVTSESDPVNTIQTRRIARATNFSAVPRQRHTSIFTIQSEKLAKRAEQQTLKGT
jgi:hypothetical protein